MQNLCEDYIPRPSKFAPRKRKFFDDKTITLPRLNEDIWFREHRQLLLAIANTKKGREILNIPQEYGEIFRFDKNCVHWRLDDGQCKADFRVGAKWANVIRYRWDLFNSYAKYFSFPRVVLSTMQVQCEGISPLVRASMKVTCATLTAYPDPSPETSTVDGEAYHDPSGTGDWATYHDAATAAGGADDTATVLNAYCDKANGGGTAFRGARFFHLYDTASLTAGATVTNAVSSLKGTSKADNQNDSFAVVQSTPASSTAIVAGDFDAFTVHSDTAAGEADITGISTSAYTDFTLPDMAWVNKTGITKLGGRVKLDYGETAGHAAAPTASTNRMSFSGADETGTSSDPKLVVTYTPAPPTAPSGLTATSFDESQNIQLDWTDNSSDESTFRIERSNDGAAGWSEIGNVAAGVVTYTDTTVGAWSTTRYYRVRALRDSDGQYSSYTSSANAKTAPQAPTIGTCTATSNSNNLTVTWTDNSSDESSFRVERSNNGSSGWAEVGNTAAGVQTYTDTSVGARDTQRYYRIRAKRDSDTRYSGYSSSANATTAPADPSALAAAINSADIRLTWTDNSSSESTFSIERKTGAYGTYAELTTDTASPYDDSTGTAEQEYYYRLRAYRASDGIYSGYTSAVNITVPPAAPTSLKASCTIANSTSSKVLLTWKINSQQETGFLLERSTDDISYSTVTTTAAGVASYEDTGLTADSTYYYRVSAVGEDGNSDPSTSVSIVVNRTNAAALMHAFEKKVRHFPY